MDKGAKRAQVIRVHCDMTSAATLTHVIQKLGEKRADMVTSDGTPDVRHQRAFDERVQHALVLAAFNFAAAAALREGGISIAKMFRVRESHVLLTFLRRHFQCVHLVKPRASSNPSIEAFVVCCGFQKSLSEAFHIERPIELDESVFDEAEHPEVVELFSCACDFTVLGMTTGTDFDSDRMYPLSFDAFDGKAHQMFDMAIAQPIDPPYA